MKKNLSKSPVARLTISAMFLALCMVLPLLTGQIPQIGRALSPMHIPVLLC
ncbi:MAG: ECF transporter S component, partial [Clostridiales bacterium]|nr:ECF transporter S component [Clostridiales bacterium]